MIRAEKKLAELAGRDVAASGGESEVKWSSDYLSLQARQNLAGWLMALLVAATIVVMTIK